MSLALLALTVPAAQAKEGGMPQLDPSTFTPQLIWLAITFIGLYLLIANVLAPKIGGAIETRRAKIAGDLAQAQVLKDQTEKALAAYEAALAEARGKAHAIISETQASLAAAAAAERARVDADIAAKVADAERRIAGTKENALAEVERIAADLAGDIVNRLIGTSASPSEVSAAIASARGR